MFDLRDYQHECLTAIDTERTAGVNRQLVVMATGLGKTVIFSQIPNLYPGRTLVLAHRGELLKQARSKIMKSNPKLNVALEKAEEKSFGFEDVIVGTVQSLARSDCKRLRGILWHAPFDNVIIDEAHHSSADTYRQIVEVLKESNPNLFLLGFTATPKRSDGIGLEKVFEKITYVKNLKDAIAEGWLVDIIPHQVKTTTSLDGLHTQSGDFKVEELSERTNTDERNSEIFRGWLKLKKQLKRKFLKTIVFCVDVEHAEAVCDLYCRQWIKAEIIIGTTPDEVRTGVLHRFGPANETEVLVNVGVATEGFDEPTIECVLDAAPTQSQAKYIQIIGRGERAICNINYPTVAERLAAIAASSKPFMHLLEVTDNGHRHSPVQVADLFDIPKKLKYKDIGVAEAARIVEKTLAEAPYINLEKARSIEHLMNLKTELVKIDIWSIEPPKEVKQASHLSWLKRDDEYHLPIDDHSTVAIKENTLGQFEVTFNGELQGTAHSLDAALERTDAWVGENWPDRMGLLNAHAKWKKDMASERQFNLLAKHHFPVRSDPDKGYQINDGAGNWIKLTKGLANHPDYIPSILKKFNSFKKAA